MSAVITGITTQIIRQPGGELTVAKNGVATARETYRGPWTLLVEQGPALNSAHPDFPALLLVRKSFSRGVGGWGALTCDYEGLDPNAESPSAFEPIYSLDVSASTEPIDSHPKWDDIVNAAGGYDNEGKKVITDEDGVFIAFGINATGGLRGVQSYYVPQVTWTRSYLSRVRPNTVNNVGKIVTPPGNPPTPTGRNWLSLGLQFTRRGGVFEVNERFLLSGPGGWNTNIYD